MTGSAIIILTITVAYMLFNIVVSLHISKKQAQMDATEGKGFLVSYFMGGRSMGGLVLAMTIMATFISASTFLGGSGLAYSRGLSWIYLAIIQVPTAFVLLAVLGKKFAIIARKIDAVTVIDFLDARYNSRAVSIISSVALVIFSIAIMVAQYIGGAVLFETITGFSYVTGLMIFGVSVLIYTAFGGFKAVVTTDVIQGTLMAVGVVVILAAIVTQGGGLEAMAEQLHTINPTWNIPNPPSVPPAFLFSLWILVGIATIGLPQTAVRGMGFKDTKSMHRAMVYGTCLFALIMLGVNLAGVYSATLITPDKIPNSDYTLPVLAKDIMPLVLFALFIAAILSVVMSTVSSLLIMASSTVVKDLYLTHFAKDKTIDPGGERERSIKNISLITTVILGVLVIILTIYPPDLIVWVNLFAFGGLQCAFLFPIVFGFFWKKANSTGSICSSISGVAAFLFFNISGISIGGTTAIIPSLVISLAAFVAGSMLGKESPKKSLSLFFTAAE
jgi:sodium/pantothenate symporter